MGPITPTAAIQGHNQAIPEFVFDVVNALIVKHLTGKRAVVKQNDIIDALVALGHSRAAVFENHWLDIEAAYRLIGWWVEYDGPGYNETYEPTFTFRADARHE